MFSCHSNELMDIFRQGEEVEEVVALLRLRNNLLRISLFKLNRRTKYTVRPISNIR
jgi:hypothetical protein